MNNKTLTWVVLAGFLAVIVVVAVLVAPKKDAGSSDDPNDKFTGLGSPQISASGNMKVYYPETGQKVSRPLIVVGLGRTFENAFSYRLLDEDDAVVAEDHGMLAAPDAGQFGPFSVSLAYPEPTQKTQWATLEVFEYSAKDGSVVNNVRIPVMLAKEESTIVKVFKLNYAADPTVSDCSFVLPVMRDIPKTTAVARAAMDDLLNGPSDAPLGKAEYEAGYWSNLPTSPVEGPGLKINSLAIKDGVARIDFNETIDKGIGGSCAVTSIRAQIEKTLMQFPTVQSVVISRNGSIDDVLQP